MASKNQCDTEATTNNIPANGVIVSASTTPGMHAIIDMRTNECEKG